MPTHDIQHDKHSAIHYVFDVHSEPKRVTDLQTEPDVENMNPQLEESVSPHIPRGGSCP